MLRLTCILISCIAVWYISDAFTRNSSLVKASARFSTCSLELRSQVPRVEPSASENENDKENFIKSLQNARKNQRMNLSPGANLATAEEQADAAYADLINASLEQSNRSELTVDEIANLSRGGRMWEKGSTSKKNKAGILGDLISVFEALSGGAHIVKNEYGET
jgi:hypothetical protein